MQKYLLPSWFPSKKSVSEKFSSLCEQQPSNLKYYSTIKSAKFKWSFVLHFWKLNFDLLNFKLKKFLKESELERIGLTSGPELESFIIHTH